MTNGLCRCGCGQPTPISTRNEYRRGHVKGQPIPYIKGHNSRAVDPWIIEDRGYHTPCWIWQLTLYANGYGRAFRDRTRRVAAHRLVYEQRVGPIPNGLDLDHLCRVRACVNPAHLEPVTRGENLRRGYAARRVAADAQRSVLSALKVEMEASR